MVATTSIFGSYSLGFVRIGCYSQFSYSLIPVAVRRMMSGGEKSLVGKSPEEKSGGETAGGKESWNHPVLGAIIRTCNYPLLKL